MKHMYVYGTQLYVWNTQYTLRRPKIANFNSAKTFKITNSQTLISANVSSFTVYHVYLYVACVAESRNKLSTNSRKHTTHLTCSTYLILENKVIKMACWSVVNHLSHNDNIISHLYIS